MWKDMVVIFLMQAAVSVSVRKGWGIHVKYQSGFRKYEPGVIITMQVHTDCRDDGTPGCVMMMMIYVSCSSGRSISSLQAFSICPDSPPNASAHPNFSQLLSEWITSSCFLVSPFLCFFEDYTEARPSMAAHHPSST
jgi:hypothetical protein